MLVRCTLVCFCLVLSACGSGGVDPEFQPYLDRFVAEAKQRGIDISPQAKEISIQFGDVSTGGFTRETAQALCFLSNSRPSTGGDSIIVDQKNWTNFSQGKFATDAKFYQEELIFHELGHCILGLSHQTRILYFCVKDPISPHPDQFYYQASAPVSIMDGQGNTPTLYGGGLKESQALYEKLRPYYLDVLFLGMEISLKI